MQALLRSRKFWLMIVDVVISTITYFVTAYAAPEVAEQIIWVIGAWQPVIVALIVGIAVEDAAVKGASTYITHDGAGDFIVKDGTGVYRDSGVRSETKG